MRTRRITVSLSTSIPRLEIAGLWAADPAMVSSTARRLENARRNWYLARPALILSFPCPDCPNSKQGSTAFILKTAAKGTAETLQDGWVSAFEHSAATFSFTLLVGAKMEERRALSQFISAPARLFEPPVLLTKFMQPGISTAVIPEPSPREEPQTI